MFDNEYNKLKKLKKKYDIGILIVIIIFVLIFTFQIFCPHIAPGLWDYLDTHPYYYPIGFFIALFLVLLVLEKFCYPYDKLERKMANKVKNNVLNEEMNNAFNNTYSQEKNQEFVKLLKKHKIGTYENINVNDCFSATYNNIKFQYGDDASFTHWNGDYLERSFRGSIYVFDTKNNIEGDLYIGKKKLFGNRGVMDLFINTKKNIEIKPSNNVLDSNISIKSKAHPNIIEDSNFLEIINEFVIINKYIIIYNKNKLFILKKNYRRDLFEITVNNKEDELKVKEHIVNDINTIKSDLDNILKYKDKLNIREDKLKGDDIINRSIDISNDDNKK